MAHLIAGLIYLPILGALFVSVTPRNYARGVALGSNLLTAIFAAMLWRYFDPAATGLQMVARHEWIPAIGAELHFGLDGLSLLLVLLTSLVFPFALLAQRMERGFCVLMLVMQAALYGTFTAQNFIL
ncbi:MAG: NADH-quinone oxidoreductase subunit M, partial [Verrucomicrobiota bacterium]|nr:NADH-quinone oxidoreductase subunit M [Verrucomicrobiota bacterium]